MRCKIRYKEKERQLCGRPKIWEQELHKAAKEDYLNFSRVIRKDLVTLFKMLRSLCYISLRRCLELELECKIMVQ